MKRTVQKARPVRIIDPTEPRLERYFQTLEKFSRIPRYELDRTIFDISGYPHYENVCSNILAFFFDPENEHGMGDLLLQALLDCVLGLEERPVVGEAGVEREAGTTNAKRLDLLITTDDFVVGIENKIYHHVNNPFGEYKALLERRAVGGRKPLGVILAPHTVEPDDQHCGFVSISYPQWLERLSQIMGPYLLNAEPKYQHYLFDFMKTMQRLAGGTMQNENAKQFFIENHDLVGELIQDYNRFQKELGDDVAKLGGLINSEGLPKVNQWIHQKTCLVHDFTTPDGCVAFDTWVEVRRGWVLSIWARDKSAQKALEAMIHPLEKAIGHRLEPMGQRFLLNTFALNKHELDEIADFVNQCVSIMAQNVAADGVQEESRSGEVEA
jgi:hypothetical protein